MAVGKLPQSNPSPLFMQKRENNMTSLVTLHLNKVALVQVVLILAIWIWEISLEIFSAIYLVQAEAVEELIMVQ